MEHTKPHLPGTESVHLFFEFTINAFAITLNSRKAEKDTGFPQGGKSTDFQGAIIMPIFDLNPLRALNLTQI